MKPVLLPWRAQQLTVSVSKFAPPSRAHLIERADLALRMQQFAEAEQLAADALKASRTDLAAIAILARALLAQNRADEAIAPLEKAARRSSDPGIETLLGAALGGAKRREEAILLLRQTASRRPPFLPAFQELAGQLAKDRRFGEAIDVIRSALAFAPQSIDLALDLGRLHLQSNQRSEARVILSRALEAEPGRIDILTTLARVLVSDGEYAAAADLYRRALGLRPGDAMLRADLAACLLEMGERDAGEASLRMALRGHPQMLGRVTAGLVLASHGRFFFRQDAVARFLGDGNG